MKCVMFGLLLALCITGCSGAAPVPSIPEIEAEAEAEAETEAEPQRCEGVLSQERDPRAALERLWTTPTVCESWLIEPMRRDFPTLWSGIRATMVERLGQFRNVSADGEQLWANFERGRVSFRVPLDEQGRLAGLWHQPPELTVSAEEDLLELYRALPGEVSVLVRTNGEHRLALAPSTPLAVGSAFKLAVLAALVDAVDAREGDWSLGWSRVVELQTDWRSHPSGRLQDWPRGAPLTVYSLAALMISESDNTATDALMALLGSDLVERYSTSLRPLPSTRQMFQLLAADEPVHENYLNGDTSTRRELLAQLSQQPLPSIAALTQAEPHPELGYRFTAEQLCHLLEQLRDQELLGINPGPFDTSRWSRIQFKGGSAPGVLNYSGLVRNESGEEHCIVATWNDRQPLDERTFATLFRSLLSFLAQEPN